jgi:hypothetical protein
VQAPYPRRRPKSLWCEKATASRVTFFHHDFAGQGERCVEVLLSMIKGQPFELTLQLCVRSSSFAKVRRRRDDDVAKPKPKNLVLLNYYGMPEIDSPSAAFACDNVLYHRERRTPYPDSR